MLIKTKELKFYNYSVNPNYERPIYLDWKVLIYKGSSIKQPFDDKFTAYLQGGGVLILSKMIYNINFHLTFKYSDMRDKPINDALHPLVNEDVSEKTEAELPQKFWNDSDVNEIEQANDFKEVNHE